MEYTRKCPMCEKDIRYIYKYMFNRAEREVRCCKSCGCKKANKHRKISIFERLCPKCGKLLKYTSYFSWWASKHRNLVCRSCAKKGKVMPMGFSEKISKIVSGKGNPMYGHHHTDEVKKFISVNNKGNKSKSGQTCNINTKMNMRNAAIKRIKLQGTSRSYNPLACIYMNTLKPTFNFIHAENSTDEYKFRGYFADGYDKNNNVWFEYDEARHYKKDGTLRNKDINRMMEIMYYLGCRFIRYNEQAKLLSEYFLDGSLTTNSKPAIFVL